MTPPPAAPATDATSAPLTVSTPAPGGAFAQSPLPRVVDPNAGNPFGGQAPDQGISGPSNPPPSPSLVFGNPGSTTVTAQPTGPTLTLPQLLNSFFGNGNANTGGQGFGGGFGRQV